MAQVAEAVFSHGVLKPIGERVLAAERDLPPAHEAGRVPRALGRVVLAAHLADVERGFLRMASLSRRRPPADPLLPGQP